MCLERKWLWAEGEGEGNLEDGELEAARYRPEKRRAWHKLTHSTPEKKAQWCNCTICSPDCPEDGPKRKGRSKKEEKKGNGEGDVRRWAMREWPNSHHSNQKSEDSTLSCKSAANQNSDNFKIFAHTRSSFVLFFFSSFCISTPIDQESGQVSV